MSNSAKDLPLWVVVSTPVVDRESYMPHLQEHLAYQHTLEDRGILFAAGPLATEGGERSGRGLIILRAATPADARRIAEGDPMHSRGLRTFTIEHWTPNEGEIVKNA